jgi:hypothetical protein
MWEPLIPSLFLEFGAIVFIAIGWPAPGNRCPAPRATVATMETVQQPSPPARRAAPVDRTRAEADLVTLLALGQPLPSQETLAQRWRVGKGTVSKWLAAWEARGLVSRHPEGRRKRVAARTGG